MENNDGTYRWSPEPSRDEPNQTPPRQPDQGGGFSGLIRKIAQYAGVVLVAAVLALAFLTSIYTVDDKQQAVVTTFGKVTDVTGAGVHFRLPFGIQQVQKVNVNVYQKIELGYRNSGSEGMDSDTVESESRMITGDYNIVNVEFFVEYKISDPVQFLYSSNDPQLILKNLIQSQVRNVVGSTGVDAVLIYS